PGRRRAWDPGLFHRSTDPPSIPSNRPMDTLLADVRYGFRLLRKSPLFTLVAAGTLALGIGANTAIFSVVDAVVIRALPYDDPDRVIVIWEDNTKAGFSKNTPAPANFNDWRRMNRTFVDMAATGGASASLTGDGAPEQIIGRRTTPNFFSVLGVRPRIGRTPSTLKKFGVVRRPMICSGAPSPVRLAEAPPVAAMSTNVRFIRRQSLKLAGAGVFFEKPALVLSSQMTMTRSGSSYGSARMTTASTTEKIAVLAPMPSASVPAATSVNRGDLRSRRKP